MSINDTNSPSTDQAPAGSSPASGSGDRSRSDGQTPTNPRHGSAIREAKGRVELERVLNSMREKAAWYHRNVWRCNHSGNKHGAEIYEHKAAVLDQFIPRFRAALDAQPRPQSERSEDALEAAFTFKAQHLAQKAADHDRWAKLAIKQGCNARHPKVIHNETAAACYRELSASIYAMLPEGVGVGASGLPNAQCPAAEQGEVGSD